MNDSVIYYVSFIPGYASLWRTSQKVYVEGENIEMRNIFQSPEDTVRFLLLLQLSRERKEFQSVSTKNCI
jgi:hypothetical protein